MEKKRRLYVQIFLLVLGLSFITLGLFLLIFFEPLYDEVLNKALSFQEGSPAYEAWQINNPPLDMDIYMFNWTNPEDARNNSVKPKFDKVGPYRFKECKEKINITWNHNDTISYGHKKLYQFDAEHSNRSLDDIITTINAVPLTIAYKIREYGFGVKKGVSASLSALTYLHVTETAGKILFEGFDDSVLGVLNFLSLGGISDKFGLFLETNGTEGQDGYYSMHTKNDEYFGKISTWNYKNRTDYFTGHCNDVKGSANEFYPKKNKKDFIELYSSELCRYAVLDYEKEVIVKGITGYKYTAKNIFDNGTLKPENACFCVGECIPSGVFNVSMCRQDSPTFLSFPNFYNADPYYTSIIEGVTPDEQRDEFYIVLEPNSGIVIDIAAQMQVNMLLQPIENLGFYQDVPKVFMPIFYFSQQITIRDDLVTSLKILQTLPDISEILSLSLIAIGIIILAWLCLSMYYHRLTCSKQKYTLEEKKQPEEMPLHS